MVVKKKEEEMAEETEVKAYEVSFGLRFARVGALIRSKADTLKFDSEVSNIDYTYVDTSQYKVLLGSCLDQIGVAVTTEIEDASTEIHTDAKGIMIFIGHVKMIMKFFDPWDVNEPPIVVSAVGLGVSRGSGYALGIAQTNAMRNLITNTFLLGTNDREGDDVRENVKPSQYLTDSAKAEKREQLLERTKSASTYATVMYGKILLKRLEETLEKDIPDDFRATLEQFKASKFADGEPIALEDDATSWIVKKTAANKIMSDLDAY